MPQNFSKDPDIQRILRTLSLAPSATPAALAALTEAGGMSADAQTYIADELQEIFLNEVMNLNTVSPNLDYTQNRGTLALATTAFVHMAKKGKTSLPITLFTERTKGNGARLALLQTAASVQSFRSNHARFIDELFSPFKSAKELTGLLEHASKQGVLERIYIAECLEGAFLKLKKDIAQYEPKDQRRLFFEKMPTEDSRRRDVLRLKFIIDIKGEASSDIIKMLATHEERYLNGAPLEHYTEDLIRVFEAAENWAENQEKLRVKREAEEAATRKAAASAQTTHSKLKALRPLRPTLKTPASGR